MLTCIAARIYIDCLNHSKQVPEISLLESLGFQFNHEKSVILVPSQTIEYLRFITDTTSMTLALPMEVHKRRNKQTQHNNTNFKI